MANKPVNILIGGEAGQGLVTLGHVLSLSLVRAGYDIVVTKSYESRVRGGHNTYAVRAAATELSAPQESVDILLALNEDTVSLHRDEMTERGVIVGDKPQTEGIDAGLGVPFDDLASGTYKNTAALGVVAAMLGLAEDEVAKTLSDVLGDHDGDAARNNRDSLSAAFEWMERQPGSYPSLPQAEHSEKRIMLNGNEAIALGALSAGVKFCSYYPMTPATSVCMTLIAHAEAMGIVAEQAEDEIAAFNMAIGAGFAGAPSLVATSGGGFALMTEAVSLAGMTEIPVVLVIAQRPGPATGLPTRTEQGDLEFVLHGAHGEFAKAIFAPGSVEECFHLTRTAFAVAHELHTPVFILTDQFLADSYRPVPPFDVTSLAPVAPCELSGSDSRPFKTYQLTEDGVSPRLFPGMSDQCVAADSSEQLVVADSDEHTEFGHITEDLSIRQQMVEKRLAKMEGLRERMLVPAVEGDTNADLLLLCWGSTHGSVKEAAAQLREQGQQVATLHLAQVWPLPTEFLEKNLAKYSRIVCVEGNATGQMAGLIRRETGVRIEEHVRRYDGLPITPEYILRNLEKR